MINMKAFSIMNDFTIKFPKFHPYQTPKFSHINFIVSSNKLAKNSKFIYPYINVSQAISGQYPKIIKAKKSVATFNLRKKNPTGLFTTLRKTKALQFLSLLNFYILPTSLTHEHFLFNLPKGRVGPPKGRNAGATLIFGFSNLTQFSFIMPYFPAQLPKGEKLELDKTGGFIQILNKSQSLTKEKSKLIHAFYFSLYNIPMGGIGNGNGNYH
jgi:hypothetical protein